MLTFGAAGKTAQQLQSGLQLPADVSVTKTGYRSLVDELNVIKFSVIETNIFDCFFLNVTIIRNIFHYNCKVHLNFNQDFTEMYLSLSQV